MGCPQCGYDPRDAAPASMCAPCRVVRFYWMDHHIARRVEWTPWHPIASAEFFAKLSPPWSAADERLVAALDVDDGGAAIRKALASGANPNLRFNGVPILFKAAGWRLGVWKLRLLLDAG